MRILAVDTSTSLASIAVTVGETVSTETSFTCQRSLSARLVPEINHLLQLAGMTIRDIDLFAASIGPGSFTGIRCGVATVQGFALATGKPCAGFSSLAVLAMNFALAALPVCALLDARKSEVYAGLYDCSGLTPRATIPDCVMPPRQFAELVRLQCGGPVILVGEGALRYADIFTSVLDSNALTAPFSHNCGRAAHGSLLAREVFHQGLALTNPSQLLPLYIRPSDAELNRQQQ